MAGRTLACLLILVCYAPLSAQSDGGALLSSHVPFIGEPSRNVLVTSSQQAKFKAGLQKLAKPSGIIFSGVVTEVAPSSLGSPGEIPTVTVTFRVEHGIHGAPSRQLTIHEWAGLWNDGPRYAVGQRLLLFLFPPSRLGLTSTVLGPLGHFRMDSAGNVLVNERQAILIGGASGEQIPLNTFVQSLARLAEDP